MSVETTQPITEADLHAYADEQLPAERRVEVDAYLATHADEAARVQAWQRDNQALRSLLAPIVHEPIPVRMPLAPAPRVLRWRIAAMAASIAFVSAGTGWVARGTVDGQIPPAARVASTAEQPIPGFARRAAVAHVVYSPEVRRPVEVGADQEEQLVTWLSKRLGAPLKPPHLERIGYELIGGRLLPGEQGPVAQFMYHNAQGQRLTLYVTRELKQGSTTGFRFAQDGPVNVFYWIDGNFGYALSAGIDKSELARVATAVYDQLESR